MNKRDKLFAEADADFLDAYKIEDDKLRMIFAALAEGVKSQ